VLYGKIDRALIPGNIYSVHDVERVMNEALGRKVDTSDVICTMGDMVKKSSLVLEGDVNGEIVFRRVLTLP
jgi:hypothetical protein